MQRREIHGALLAVRVGVGVRILILGILVCDNVHIGVIPHNTCTCTSNRTHIHYDSMHSIDTTTRTRS